MTLTLMGELNVDSCLRGRDRLGTFPMTLFQVEEPNSAPGTTQLRPSGCSSCGGKSGEPPVLSHWVGWGPVRKSKGKDQKLS
jgi:hypothetical protein